MIPGKNDLATLRPDLLQYWDYTRNGDITPSSVMLHSKTRVYWICDHGHSIYRKVRTVTEQGFVCYACKQHYAEGIHKSASRPFSEEYPEIAAMWHPTKNGTLTPDKVSSHSQRKVWWQCPRGHEWEAKVDSNTRCRVKICPECRRIPDPGRSLAEKHPDAASMWHPTKNADITPFDVFSGSKRKVWWQCPRGHEWEADVCKVSRNPSCPECKAIEMRNSIPPVEPSESLAEVDPEAAALWHPTKNEDLTPYNFTTESRRKVWWQCPEGHEWRAEIHNVHIGLWCPVCYADCKFYLVPPKPGKSLAEVDPEASSLWHPEKNHNMTPYDVTPCSHYTAWWRCPRGHEWESRVANVHRKAICPKCPRKPIPGNSLAEVDPDAAALWHPTKNDGLTPYDVTHSSNMRVWWQCSQGHEWETTVTNVHNGSRCQVCKRLERRGIKPNDSQSQQR